MAGVSGGTAEKRSGLTPFRAGRCPVRAICGSPDPPVVRRRSLLPLKSVNGNRIRTTSPLVIEPLPQIGRRVQLFLVGQKGKRFAFGR